MSTIQEAIFVPGRGKPKNRDALIKELKYQDSPAVVNISYQGEEFQETVPGNVGRTCYNKLG